MRHYCRVAQVRMKLARPLYSRWNLKLTVDGGMIVERIYWQIGKATGSLLTSHSLVP